MAKHTQMKVWEYGLINEKSVKAIWYLKILMLLAVVAGLIRCIFWVAAPFIDTLTAQTKTLDILELAERGIALAVLLLSSCFSAIKVIREILFPKIQANVAQIICGIRYDLDEEEKSLFVSDDDEDEHNDNSEETDFIMFINIGFKVEGKMTGKQGAFADINKMAITYHGKRFQVKQKIKGWNCFGKYNTGVISLRNDGDQYETEILCKIRENSNIFDFFEETKEVGEISFGFSFFDGARNRYCVNGQPYILRQECSQIYKGSYQWGYKADKESKKSESR